jgi:hypothetical protein
VGATLKVIYKKLDELLEVATQEYEYEPPDMTQIEKAWNHGGAWFFGQKHTEESKKKIGLSRLGKKQSQETKDRRSTSLKGRKLSDEARQNMAKAQQRRFATESGRAHQRKASAIANQNYTQERKDKISMSLKGKKQHENFGSEVRARADLDRKR